MPQQLAEACVGIEACPQREGIDERAHDGLGRQPIAVRDRNTDDQIRALRVAIEQDLERREHHHEECRALRFRKYTEVVEQVFGQRQRLHCTRGRSTCTARAISRQLDRFRTLELLEPVRKLRRQTFVRQVLPLPVCIVDECQRGIRDLRGRRRMIVET